MAKEYRKTKSFWRGYIDAQNKHDVYTKSPIVTAERAKVLRPLAEILNAKIEPYRGDLFKVDIPERVFAKFPTEKDENYLRGWFAAKGQVYKDPLKITICGNNIEKFRVHLQAFMETRLPRTQQPSKTSEVTRLTLTGEKAREALKFLRPVGVPK